MKKLIKSLDKKISVRQAGTGSIYVAFNGKKIRIANHEPNHAMTRMRGNADLEIYTHDLVGKEINNKYDVVEKVADYLGLEIKGSVKSAITRHNNKALKESNRLSKIMSDNKKEMDEIQKKIKVFHSTIKKITKGKDKELKTLFDEADKYGDLGTNGGQRRKRRVSYFKREFKARFGIEATPSDVKSALDN